MIQNTNITDEILTENYKLIGQNVKRVRKEKGITQLELSLAIGHKAVGTISMAELYINKKHFNIEHLIKIANVLDVDISEFFKDIKTKQD